MYGKKQTYTLTTGRVVTRWELVNRQFSDKTWCGGRERREPSIDPWGTPPVNEVLVLVVNTIGGSV